MFDYAFSSMHNKIDETYESLLEKAFEPYGINRENIIENAHRITVYHRQAVSDLFRTIDDIHIDGEYAFSIQKTLRYEEQAPGVMAMTADVGIVRGEKND